MGVKMQGKKSKISIESDDTKHDSKGRLWSKVKSTKDKDKDKKEKK